MRRVSHVPRKKASVLSIILFAVVIAGCSGCTAAPMSPELLALSAELRNTPRVAAGNRFVLAVKDGKVYGWGTNEDILIRENTDIPYSWDKPIVIPIPDEVISVSAGIVHAIALTKGGDVWTWGNGKLGGTATVRPVNKVGGKLPWKSKPFKVEELPKIVKISAGNAHNLALTLDGEVWAWGGINREKAGRLFLLLRLHI